MTLLEMLLNQKLSLLQLACKLKKLVMYLMHPIRIIMTLKESLINSAY